MEITLSPMAGKEMFRKTRDWMNKQVDAMLRKQYARLEEEAGIFVKMGYDPQELVIIDYGEGEKDVLPLSMFRE